MATNNEPWTIWVTCRLTCSVSEYMVDKVRLLSVNSSTVSSCSIVETQAPQLTTILCRHYLLKSQVFRVAEIIPLREQHVQSMLLCLIKQVFISWPQTSRDGAGCWRRALNRLIAAFRNISTKHSLYDQGTINSNGSSFWQLAFVVV